MSVEFDHSAQLCKSHHHGGRNPPREARVNLLTPDEEVPELLRSQIPRAAARRRVLPPVSAARRSEQAVRAVGVPRLPRRRKRNVR